MFHHAIFALFNLKCLAEGGIDWDRTLSAFDEATDTSGVLLAKHSDGSFGGVELGKGDAREVGLLGSEVNRRSKCTVSAFFNRA